VKVHDTPDVMGIDKSEKVWDNDFVWYSTISLLHAARIDTPVFLTVFSPGKGAPMTPYLSGERSTCAGGGAVLQNATCE
jgi:hypothetical protein